MYPHCRSHVGIGSVLQIRIPTISWRTSLNQYYHNMGIACIYTFITIWYLSFYHGVFATPKLYMWHYTCGFQADSEGVVTTNFRQCIAEMRPGGENVAINNDVTTVSPSARDRTKPCGTDNNFVLSVPVTDKTLDSLVIPKCLGIIWKFTGCRLFRSDTFS